MSRPLPPPLSPTVVEPVERPVYDMSMPITPSTHNGDDAISPLTLTTTIYKDYKKWNSVQL